MKALILNSGTGSRMGDITKSHPKCMTVIDGGKTILSAQLQALADCGITDIVITTGPFADKLEAYCRHLQTVLPMEFTFVPNPIYAQTNYIYSIYLAREYLQDDDIILLHGDLLFDKKALQQLLSAQGSGMIVSSTLPLPEKDFKAVIKEGFITKIGIEFFDNSFAAQPLYKLMKNDWHVWLKSIEAFCEAGNVKCYAENAFNKVSARCRIAPVDVKDILCKEIDSIEDYNELKGKVDNMKEKTVYMCFSTDIIHGGHISIINKAAALGRLIIGVMTDEAVATYKRFPLLSYKERAEIIGNIKGVAEVVEQNTLSYIPNIKKYQPDIIVHGDEWREGVQAPVRQEVVEALKEYGGELIEFPYSANEEYKKIEAHSVEQLSIPDARRGRLRKLLGMNKLVTAMEAHSGITGLIVEKTTVYKDGKASSFDAMWISSLCDSTAKGKPDIELVDMTSRFRTIDDIMEVTTKPIIFDGDTGGLAEHFVYTVRSLERMGVSMIIIEDKTGLKKNSLFGTEVKQTQDSIENFSAKIRAGKKAQKTKDFMICARIESLILERGMEDALERAHAFTEAGADAIMIHSRKKDPAEIKEFIEKFRQQDKITPIVLVPTSFNTVYEEEWKELGANIIIYANQLTRTGFPAMQDAAKTILENHRAKECDDKCMSIKEIITLIPEE